MISRKELKRRSKDQLSGQWTIPVLITLVTGIISMTMSYVCTKHNEPISLTILIQIFQIAINVCFISFYLKISRDKDIILSDFFPDGKTLLKGTGVQFLEILLCIPIIIVIILISSAGFYWVLSKGIINIFDMANYGLSYIDNLSLGVIALFLLWIVLIYLAITIYSSYFILALNFICEDNSRGVWECIKISCKYMKGNIWRFIVLQLSFLGWILGATFFTLGIGFLWLMPYIMTTNLNFFNEIIGYKKDNNTEGNMEFFEK